MSRVTRAARRLVESQFGPLWVLGELSGLKRYQSGHWYFSLRDADAQVRCVMWRDYARRIREPMDEGTAVFAFAKPTVFEERGEFRLSVTRLLPTAAVGLQQRLLEEAKAALANDGLLDPARKRPLPRFPTRVAVVTSLDGAALHDIISVATRRWPAAHLVVVGTRVQGADAEWEVVRALDTVNRIPNLECCILARGGGDREDLSLFNKESVCRALAAVSVPTVSAVGHETDVSLTDLVADVRAATPSAAAEHVFPDLAEVRRLADGLGVRLGGSLGRHSRLARERLARTADRMERHVRALLEGHRQRVARAAASLDALSPLRVLDRGYSMALDADGRVLKRRSEFPSGTPFTLRVTDGAVTARAD